MLLGCGNPDDDTGDGDVDDRCGEEEEEGKVGRRTAAFFSCFHIMCKKIPSLIILLRKIPTVQSYSF